MNKFQKWARPILGYINCAFCVLRRAQANKQCFSLHIYLYFVMFVKTQTFTWRLFVAAVTAFDAAANIERSMTLKKNLGIFTKVVFNNFLQLNVFISWKIMSNQRVNIVWVCVRVCVLYVYNVYIDFILNKIIVFCAHWYSHISIDLRSYIQIIRKVSCIVYSILNVWFSPMDWCYFTKIFLLRSSSATNNKHRCWMDQTHVRLFA